MKSKVHLNKFTFIVPFAGTTKEIDFAKKTIPKMIELEPSEIIFGIDDVLDLKTIDKIDTICKSKNYSSYRYIKVKFDANWKFQLAHVLWSCINKSSNDIICTINVDESVKPEILKGANYVGKKNIGVYSAQGVPYMGKYSDVFKRIVHQINLWLEPKPFKRFTGVYWIYRPYFMNFMDKSYYMSIQNGSDTAIFEKAESSKYDVIYSRKYSHTLLDIDHDILPQIQFLIGMWNFVNHTYDKRSKIIGHKRWAKLASIKTSTPYKYKGYIYAMKHPENTIVQKAAKKSKNEYVTSWKSSSHEITKLVDSV